MHIEQAAASGTHPAIELTKKGEAYAAAALAEADGIIFLVLDSRDRTTLATTIERLIGLLDEQDGDPDLEASLGWGQQLQAVLHADAHDEAEDENEHGGDICDEPHDPADCGDDELSLGWTEKCGQGFDEWQKNRQFVAGVDSLEPYERGFNVNVPMLSFDGAGYQQTRGALRELQRRRPDVRQEYVRTAPGYGW